MTMNEGVHVTWKINREAITNEDGEIDPGKRSGLKSEVQEKFDEDIETTLGVAEEAEPGTTIALCALVLGSIRTAIMVKEYLDSREETDKVEVTTADGSFVEVTGSNGETVVEITSPDGDTEVVKVDR
ncbi:hypothetical protein HISP_12755 [Haloarcula hispanica N601]|uniref:Uncharacterized protein n=2 Tax=Haloarcula hispanica TaxID=51589 RepID=V5TQZ4_HALHI|nr:hypothetical protein [Haloarcula hispanica]AEM58092.1 hypothetical protein HAH_2505 [Haloarcula hispanica ATCC 33960]AHB67523.1 hypothetical protein HISP_12755 [Haloarcula hispanica N601]